MTAARGAHGGALTLVQADADKENDASNDAGAPLGPPCAVLHSVAVENFKSYAGTHAFGPFSRFTAIIGPNGSGKSNLLDAVAFGLGVQARHVRGTSAADLICRKEREGINAASVAVTLVKSAHAGAGGSAGGGSAAGGGADGGSAGDGVRAASDGVRAASDGVRAASDGVRAAGAPVASTSPVKALPGTGDTAFAAPPSPLVSTAPPSQPSPAPDSFVTFKRTIKVTGEDRGAVAISHELNGKRVSAAAYRREAMLLGVNVRASNFIVFQGDVIDVARRTPAELGLFLEQVSGADALRGTFEAAETRLKALADECRATVVQRQRLAAQKNDLQKQVAAVEAHRALQEKARRAETELAAFELFANDAQAEREKCELDAAVEAAKKLAHDVAEAQAELRTTDSAMVTAREERQRLEGLQRAAAEAAVADKRSLEKENAEMEFERKRRAAQVRTADERSAAAQRLARSEEELRDQVQECESEVERLRAGAGAASPVGSVPAALLSTYRELEGRAATASGGIRAELAGAERRAALARERGAAAEAALAAAASRRAAGAERLAAVSAEVAAAEAAAAEARAAVDAAAAAAAAGAAAAEDFAGDTAAAERALLAEQRALEGEVAASLLRREEGSRGARQAQLVARLSRALGPEILGLCPSLLTLANRRFATAISAALGRFNETVAVEAFATARAAVKLLKEWRAGPLEFAALDTVAAPAELPAAKIAEIARRVPGAVPALDCVVYDPRLEPVVRAALGDCFVVPDLRAAEALAFSAAPAVGLRVKVVTLEGERVLKNGNFTIETAAGGQRAAAGAPAELAAYSAAGGAAGAGGGGSAAAAARLSSLRAQLSALRSAVSARADQARELSAARLALATAEGRLAVLARERERLAAAAAPAAAQAAELERVRGAAAAEAAAADAEVARAAAALAAVENEIFSSLGGDADLAAVRAAAREAETARKEAAEGVREAERKLERLRTALRKARSDLSTAQSQAAAAAKAVSATAGGAVAALEKRVAGLRQRAEAAEAQGAAVAARVAALAEEEAAGAARLRAARRRLADLRTTAAAADAAAARRAEALDALTADGAALLRKALIDGLTFPMASGTMAGLAEAVGLGRLALPAPKAAAEPAASLEAALTASPAAPSPTVPSSPAAAPTPASAAGLACMTDDRAASAEPPEIDFDKILSQKLQEACCGDDSKVRGARRRLQEALGAVRAELARAPSPNFRAVERLGSAAEAGERLAVQARDLERARAAQEREYGQVRRELLRRFMTCFDTVRREINRIYNELTGGSGDGDDGTGGQAFLDLMETPAVTGFGPCRLDVVFSVMPPTKRFCELKRLSGGEKTLAALALLFAVQRVHRGSAFFVLDEVDAALDPVNAGSLAAFLMRAPFQVVVISHADRVFARADRLLGVYADAASSHTLTLDLAQYATDDGAEEDCGKE